MNKKQLFTLTFLTTLFFLSGVHAATLFWIGGTGDWNVASNWNTNSIPTANDFVRIEAGDIVTIPTGYAAVAQGVRLNLGGSLTIANTASLTINNTALHGVEMFNANDVFINNGTLTIGNTGNINHTGILFNGGTFTNNADGVINIDRTTQDGIASFSGTAKIFTNYGTINVGQSGVIGQHGIRIPEGTYENKANATINIDNTNGRGVEMASNGTLNNEGTITIGANIPTKKIAIIFWGGTINNNTGGLIDVAGSVEDGIASFGGTPIMNNSGTVKIGSNTNVREGIWFNNVLTFNNLNGGLLEINRVNNKGIFMADAGSAFNNEGTLKIGNEGPVGFEGIFIQSGNFQNKENANLQIDSTGSFALYLPSSSSFATNDGTISIGQNNKIGRMGIKIIDGEFENYSDGIIHLDDCSRGIEMSQGLFDNDGSITIGANTPPSSDGIAFFGVADFNNNMGGLIEIAAAGRDGIRNYKLAQPTNFTNAATIKIGTGGAVKNGIYSFGMDFINQKNGSIEIENASEFGFYIRNQSPKKWINEGTIKSDGNFGGFYIIDQTVFENKPSGIIDITGGSNSIAAINCLQCLFSNEGEITLGKNEPLGKGIKSSFPIANDGTIIFKSVTEDGIFHGTTLTNNAGATIEIPADGALNINGSLNNDGTINNLSTLGGTGFLNQNATLTNGTDAVVAPGTSPGQLNVTGNFDFAEADYICEINGTTQGTEYDYFNHSSGEIDLTDATLKVDWGSFMPTATDTFTVLSYDTKIGKFASVDIPNVNGKKWVLVYYDMDKLLKVEELQVNITSTFFCVEDGTLTVTASATPGYDIEYSTNGTDFQSSNVITGLSNGDHTITVRIVGETITNTLLVTIPSACPSTPIIYVNTAVGAGCKDGHTWATAFTDLQDALSLAANCNNVAEIWVATGTYHPTNGTFRSASFQLQNGVTIYGGFTGNEMSVTERDWIVNETILSGDIGTQGVATDNSYHVFYHNAASINNTAILDGFVISDGYADSVNDHARGAGMYNNNSSPTVKNCTFKNNSAHFAGGAIFNKTNSAIIEHCDLENNSAEIGAGFYNGISSSTSIKYCSFENNSASQNGGAIFNVSASGNTVMNCYFQGNSATDNGGAFYNLSTSPNIINCAFLANNATEGSAILNQSSSFPNIINCTFYDNTASADGGAINNQMGTGSNISNCILWGNTDGVSNTQIVSSPSSTTVTHSIVQQATGVYPGSGNKNVDPMFISSTDLQLKTCSPAKNAGINSANDTSWDLADEPRKMFVQIDMGAYETQVDDGLPNTWTGNGDGQMWTDAANWSYDRCPNKCHDVLIPTSHNVMIPAGHTGAGRTLLVELGATLETDSGGGEMDIEKQ